MEHNVYASLRELAETTTRHNEKLKNAHMDLDFLVQKAVDLGIINFSDEGSGIAGMIATFKEACEATYKKSQGEIA